MTSIKRFNKLVRVVKSNITCSESKEMEVELKLIDAKLSRKLYRNQEGVNSNEEDSDNSSDEWI